MIYSCKSEKSKTEGAENSTGETTTSAKTDTVPAKSEPATTMKFIDLEKLPGKWYQVIDGKETPIGFEFQKDYKLKALEHKGWTGIKWAPGNGNMLMLFFKDDHNQDVKSLYRIDELEGDTLKMLKAVGGGNEVYVRKK